MGLAACHVMMNAFYYDPNNTSIFTNITITRYEEGAEMEVPMNAFYYDPFCENIDQSRQYH
jgi:hypothetical protein